MNDLATVNRHLARLVLATGAAFAVGALGLTILTGEVAMMLGSALGLTSAGYARQALLSSHATVERVVSGRRIAVAAD
jgi:hypothetical protein